MTAVDRMKWASLGVVFALCALLAAVEMIDTSGCPGPGAAGEVVNVTYSPTGMVGEYDVAVKRDGDGTVCVIRQSSGAWRVGDRVRGDRK